MQRVLLLNYAIKNSLTSQNLIATNAHNSDENEKIEASAGAHLVSSNSNAQHDFFALKCASAFAENTPVQRVKLLNNFQTKII